MIRVTADERCPTVFSIPRSSIATLAAHSPNPGALHLPQTSVADFYDFTLWLQTHRIIHYPHHGIEYAVEHQAQRLIAALALGVRLQSQAYQAAALREFHVLAVLLPWPEDHVNAIFAVTRPPRAQVEPRLVDLRHLPAAQRLIVAIVAAKTCGAGKRKVRQGPRDKNVERGDRIQAKTFWRAYDEFCLQSGGECEYPRTVEGLL